MIANNYLISGHCRSKIHARVSLDPQNQKQVPEIYNAIIVFFFPHTQAAVIYSRSESAESETFFFANFLHRIGFFFFSYWGERWVKSETWRKAIIEQVVAGFLRASLHRKERRGESLKRFA